MSQTYTFHYPVSPSNIDKKIIEPSTAFRNEVTKVFWSIVGFIITYFLLIIGAIVLAILCGYGGLLLIEFRPGLFTILIGLGLIAFGFMVLFFLVKFVFNTNSTDRSGLIQITAKDQPMLFDFINQLAKEVSISPPKHIYISGNVNASVFYESGFWSMFFPVRKNLQIGLGLVNSANISELKAVIAHEFGHFSQRSMKLGSYVYNVNKVIYNMLYDNREYHRSLESFGNISSYFSFFAILTQAVVEILQSILRSQYVHINERHLALSRQMEFHADSVAASVSGSHALISLLRRLEVSNYCYQRVISYYTNWQRQNFKALNVYPDHTEVMKHIADLNGLEVQEGLVHVTSSSFVGKPQSRIAIHDLWSTHPNIDDREIHLRSLNITADHVTTSSWNLFVNAENLQRQITDLLYEEVNFPTAPKLITDESFRSLYYDQIERYSFDKQYKGFYDDHEISEFNAEEVSKEAIKFNSLEEILTKPALQLSVRIKEMESEIELLESIRHKSSRVEDFSFKGKEYSKKDAAALIKIIYKEVTETKNLLHQTDKQIFQLYHQCAAQRGENQLAINAYQKMFSTLKFCRDEERIIEDIIREVSQLHSGSVSGSMAFAVNNNMLRKEIPVKKAMRELIKNKEYASYLTIEDNEKLTSFTGQQRESYAFPKMDANAINHFMDCMHTYNSIIFTVALDVKKQTLKKQLELIQFSSSS